MDIYTGSFSTGAGTEQRNVSTTVSNSTVDKTNSTEVSSYSLCFTEYCILNTILISIISMSGIITNIIVIVAVRIDKRLHQPTFVVIACLALTDFTFLVARYTRYLIDVYFSDVIANVQYQILNACLDLVGVIAGVSSIFHVILLSVIRYFIVVHPLTSRVYLTTTKVILVSMVLWVISTGNGVFYIYAVIINQSDKDLQQLTNKVETIIISVLPIVLIGLLHVLKARTLLNSLSNKGKTIRRMSRMVTFVICMYLITTTPINLIDMVKLVLQKRHRDTKWFYGLSQAARVCLFLNYAINPLIYFLYSPPFKRFFKETFKRNQISGTSSAPLMSTNESKL